MLLFTLLFTLVFTLLFTLLFTLFFGQMAAEVYTNPNNARVHHGLGVALYAAGRKEEAMQVFTHVDVLLLLVVYLLCTTQKTMIWKPYS